MGIFQKISEGLRKTRESFSRRMSMIFGAFTKIDEEFFEELEETLILADVGAKTSEEICKELRRRGVPALKVVFSPEEPRPTGVRTPGSVSFVPGAAGLVLAGAVVRALAEGPGKKDC